MWEKESQGGREGLGRVRRNTDKECGWLR